MDEPKFNAQQLLELICDDYCRIPLLHSGDDLTQRCDECEIAQRVAELLEIDETELFTLGGNYG